MKIIISNAEISVDSPWKYVAACSDEDSLYYSGRGYTLTEAVGDFIISNREKLGLEFILPGRDVR